MSPYRVLLLPSHPGKHAANIKQAADDIADVKAALDGKPPPFLAGFTPVQLQKRLEQMEDRTNLLLQLQLRTQAPQRQGTAGE